MSRGIPAATDGRRRYTGAMRKFTSLTLALLMMAAIPAAPSDSIPRKSAEFTIHEPSGKNVLLSSFKGKVVMIEFFFLRSQECLQVAQIMNKLNADLGSRGFTAIAVAFPAPGMSEANGPLVGYTAENLKLTYTVGYASVAEVDQYLQPGGAHKLRIPQILILDRTGVIRAQSPPNREAALQTMENETYLRTLLDGLLKENPAPAKQTSAQKSQKNP